MTAPLRCKYSGHSDCRRGAVYVHRRYESRLGAVVTKAKRKVPREFDYHIVKYDYQSESVSFIQCLDFDTAPEPAVGQIVSVRWYGTTHKRQPPCDPEIYHHKWLFVDDDYDGFDVEESKQRSLRWSSLEGVDRRRIGRKGYWERCILPRLVDEYEEDE